jgi:hypothetical protein
VKVVLRDEHDTKVRASLDNALASRRARKLWQWHGHGGSQQLERTWYLVRYGLIRVHAETYLGIAISGPRSLIEAIARDVHRTLRASSDAPAA